jgi:hypothetical protein
MRTSDWKHDSAVLGTNLSTKVPILSYGSPDNTAILTPQETGWLAARAM